MIQGSIPSTLLISTRSMLLSLGIRESGKLVFSLCLRVFFRVLRTFGIGLKLSGINFVASLEAKTE